MPVGPQNINHILYQTPCISADTNCGSLMVRTSAHMLEVDDSNPGRHTPLEFQNIYVDIYY